MSNPKLTIILNVSCAHDTSIATQGSFGPRSHEQTDIELSDPNAETISLGLTNWDVDSQVSYEPTEEVSRSQSNTTNSADQQGAIRACDAQLRGEVTGPPPTHQLPLETSPDAMEQIEDLLLFEWQFLEDTPTAEEQRQLDVGMFGRLLCLAESTNFSGAVILAFGGGYLRMFGARTASDAFDQTKPSSLGIKL